MEDLDQKRLEATDDLLKYVRVHAKRTKDDASRIAFSEIALELSEKADRLRQTSAAINGRVTTVPTTADLAG